MRLKDMAEGVKDMFMFDPKKLRVEPGWNARHKTPEYEAGIAELMGSIREHGVLEPLTVYVENDTPIVTNGHRRLEAVHRLLKEGLNDILVPLRVEPKGSNEADRVLSMLTRNSGVPLTSHETAEVCKRLIGYGWDTQKVAKKTGFTATHVDNLLSLLEAPQAALDMLDRGEVAASTVIAVIKEHGGKEGLELLKDATALAATKGKAKATPKHVGAVLVTRASANAAELAQGLEEEPEDEGEELASVPKATTEPMRQQAACTAERPVKKAPKDPSIDWNKVGPTLKKHLEAIFNAENPEKAIRKAADFYEKTFTD